MKAMKWIFRALAVAVSFSHACNYDEGQCWLRSEDDGQGAVGGGPIVPAGAGGFGDVPPEPQDATDPPPPDCDPDGATELGELQCPKSNWGAECMIACAGYGVNCPAGKKHSVTDEMGQLYKCCNCKGDKRCWYIYSNNDFCVFRPEAKTFHCGI